MQIRIWLINAALLAVVVISSINTYRIWTQPPQWQPDMTTGKKQQLKAVRVVSTRLPPESTFNVVTDRNLFSESRQTAVPPLTTDSAEDLSDAKVLAIPPEETSVKINNRTILLYGVVMAGDMKKALITNPFQKGRERKEMWIAPREMLDAYQVYDIEPKRVLFRKEGKIYQISMNEKSKPRAPGAATSLPSAKKPAVVHAGTSKADTKKTPKGKNAGQTQPAADEIIMTPFGPLGDKKK